MHTENQENNKNKKEDKRKNVLLKIITLVIIILLLLLCFRSCYKSDSISSGITEIVEGDLDSISRTVNKVNNEDLDTNKLMFSTFLNKNVFVDENNRANLLIKNDKSNSYNAYVEYYIDGSLIYKTDIIAPGYKQEYADFTDVKLNNGENEAKSVFCIIDSDGTKLNTVTIPVKITK